MCSGPPYIRPYYRRAEQLLGPPPGAPVNTVMLNSRCINLCTHHKHAKYSQMCNVQTPNSRTDRRSHAELSSGPHAYICMHSGVMQSVRNVQKASLLHALGFFIHGQNYILEARKSAGAQEMLLFLTTFTQEKNEITAAVKGKIK